MLPCTSFYSFTATLCVVLSPLRCQGRFDATLTSARFVIVTECLCECLYFRNWFCLSHKEACSCKQSAMPARIRVHVNRQLSASMLNASHDAFTTTLKSHNPSLNYYDPLLFCLFSCWCRGRVFTALWTQWALPSPRLDVTRIEMERTGALLSDVVCI